MDLKLNLPNGWSCQSSHNISVIVLRWSVCPLMSNSYYLCSLIRFLILIYMQLEGFCSPCAFISRLILIANLILELSSSFHHFSFFSIPSDLFIWTTPSKPSLHWQRFHPNHITPLSCGRLTKCSSRRESISLITTNLQEQSSQKIWSHSSGTSERWKNQENLLAVSYLQLTSEFL